MKQKLLKFVLTFAVLLALFIIPQTADAATSGIYTYSVSGGKVTITDCSTSATGSITIPSTLGGYPVTSIGYEAFANCYYLSSITIPESVTSIGHHAFENCTSLTSITIPDSVTSIGIYAFENTGYFNNSNNWENDVLYIGNHLIEAKPSISGNYTIRTGTKTIAGDAFEECNGLTSITIPDSVTTIGGYAFGYCSNLKSITLGKGITNIEVAAFYECCSLTSIIIPNSVTNIGIWAFNGCFELTSITIPDSVINIADEAFYGCGKLKTVHYVGSKSKFDSITIGDGNDYLKSAHKIYSICTYKFLDNNGNTIKEHTTDYGTVIYAPDVILTKPATAKYTYTHTGWNGFTEGMTLTEDITFTPIFSSVINQYTYKIIDEDGTVIKEATVDYGNKISTSDISVPSGFRLVLYTDKACTTEYNLENYVVENVTLYAKFVFELSYSVANGEATITGCDTSVSGSITIPSTIDGYPVKAIGTKAFYNCSKLTGITIHNGVTKIDFSAFNGCSALKSITMPDSIISIGDSAFSGCSSLTSINLPDSLTSIGASAFRGCLGLKSIIIPDGVKSIGGSLFYGCSALSDITIPDGITSIGYSAFDGCTSLTSITIPDSVTSIGNFAFYNCKKLESVYWNAVEVSDLTSSSNLFYNAGILGNGIQVVFGDGVKTIPSYIFHTNSSSYFPRVISVTLGNHITNIGEYAFYNLASLRKVIYNGSQSQYKSIRIRSNNQGLTNTDITFLLCTYKFVDHNGNKIKEQTLDYGTVITAPVSVITKPSTQKYTYIFTGWNGFTEGMTLTKDITFTPIFSSVINQYTYKFIDEDGTVVKEATVDYGTVISAPDMEDKAEYYVFDKWQGYTSGMTVTSDVTFNAVYRNVEYTITVSGTTKRVTLTYNSEYLLPVQQKSEYIFKGYYTGENGTGTQLTDESGECIAPYNVTKSITAYPYFESVYLDKICVEGSTSVCPGDTLTQSIVFATNKDSMYLTATVKYPQSFVLNKIENVDFSEISKDSETTKDGYTYLNITGLYSYEGVNIPLNTKIILMELVFDVSTDAKVGTETVELSDVIFIGESDYQMNNTVSNIVSVNPKLAESVLISGPSQTDVQTVYTAAILPDYATNKEVEWSVDDETIATIDQNGKLTPVKTGTVTITATAKDGSGVYATKTVEIVCYAKLDSLDFGSSLCIEQFSPDKREYIVYVDDDATTIVLNPTFSGGVVRPNGSGIWISGREKEFALTGDTTTIVLNRENVEGYVNSAYTITVEKLSSSKVVSSDTIVACPENVTEGQTVIIALYNGKALSQVASFRYEGIPVCLKADVTYQDAKIMVWNSISGAKPLYKPEIISR